MAKPNPVARIWRAVAGRRADTEDRRIQLERAIRDQQGRQRPLDTAAVAGANTQRQLQDLIDRQGEAIVTLRGELAQARGMAERARTGGAPVAEQFDANARMLAERLRQAEMAVGGLERLRDLAGQTAAQNRGIARQNEQLLQRSLVERVALLSRLERDEMQRQLAEALAQLDQTRRAADPPP